MLTIDDFDGKNLTKSFSGLVLFFADWCGHCKRLLPVWSELESSVKSVRKFDCSNSDDENVAEVMKRFEISGYPSIMIFKDGKLQGKYTGGRSKEDLEKFFSDNGGDASDVAPSGMGLHHYIFIFLIILIMCLLGFNLFYKNN